MAIALKGEAAVSVEAGTFTLAFTLGACAAIENHFDGRSINAVLKEIEGEEPKISTFLVVIWAGLKKHHALTLDEVGDLVSLHEFPLWGAAISRAMSAGAMEGKGKATHPRKAATPR